MERFVYLGGEDSLFYFEYFEFWVFLRILGRNIYWVIVYRDLKFGRKI